MIDEKRFLTRQKKKKKKKNDLRTYDKTDKITTSPV